jgi:hypothetical protein
LLEAAKHTLGSLAEPARRGRIVADDVPECLKKLCSA